MRKCNAGTKCSRLVIRQGTRASWSGSDLSRKTLIASGQKVDNPQRGGGTATPPEAMKTYSISRIARACGLSRSTLLYYDRLGLLEPSGRTGSGYRYYTETDQKRLERIGYFHQAGLKLKEIRAVLSSGGKPGTRLLEQRMRETAENIIGLKRQQRL